MHACTTLGILRGPRHKTGGSPLKGFLQGQYTLHPSLTRRNSDENPEASPPIRGSSAPSLPPPLHGPLGAAPRGAEPRGGPGQEAAPGPALGGSLCYSRESLCEGSLVPKESSMRGVARRGVLPHHLPGWYPLSFCIP